MIIHESGVSSRSIRYFFTPSSFAERIFYYPTRVGHYFCDRNYHFTSYCETAMQASHHMNYMLMFVKQGMMQITLEEQTRTLAAKQIVLFDCQKPHEYIALTDDVEFYWFLFNGSESERFYHFILESHDNSHILDAGDPTQLQLLISRLLTYGEIAHRMSERSCSETIYSILCQLLTTNIQDDTQISLMDRALAMMNRHFTESLTVEEVAAHIGLSTSYFTKQFRMHTGFSPYEYLTLQRIQRAQELLTSTTLTVKQIAYEIGYNSEENFIRSFKKKTGLSPTNFRKYPL